MFGYRKWLKIDDKVFDSPQIYPEILDVKDVYTIKYTMDKDQPIDPSSYEGYKVTSEIMTLYKLTFINTDLNCNIDERMPLSLDDLDIFYRYTVSCIFYTKDHTKNMTRVLTFKTNYSKDKRFLKDSDTYSIEENDVEGIKSIAPYVSSSSSSYYDHNPRVEFPEDNRKESLQPPGMIN